MGSDGALGERRPTHCGLRVGQASPKPPFWGSVRTLRAPDAKDQADRTNRPFRCGRERTWNLRAVMGEWQSELT